MTRTWLVTITANAAWTWVGCRNAGARHTDWIVAAFSSTPRRLARRNTATILDLGSRAAR